MTSTLARDYLFKATSAGADAQSTNPATVGALGTPFDVGLCTNGSFQCAWAGLTGTLDGQFEVYTSNDGIKWQPKFDLSGAAIVLPVTGADDNDMIALNGVISEEFYAIYWTANGVTGGTIEVIGVGK